MPSRTTAQDDPTFNTIAALFLSATSPTAADHESDGALRALRRKLVGAGIDPHAVADRIRGCGSFAPRLEEAPVFTTMPLGVRRLWLDALCLRVSTSDWERRFIADVRRRALSSLNLLSLAQTRTLQQLVDRAWVAGVRA